MANYILKELPGEMTEGRTVVYPKMQTYSLHDYEMVIRDMRVYANGIGEGIIRAVFDALTDSIRLQLQKKPFCRNRRSMRMRIPS